MLSPLTARGVRKIARFTYAVLVLLYRFWSGSADKHDAKNTVSRDSSQELGQTGRASESERINPAVTRNVEVPVGGENGAEVLQTAHLFLAGVDALSGDRVETVEH